MYNITYFLFKNSYNLFQDIDTKRIGEIGFESFKYFYHNLIHDEEVSI